MVLGGPRISPRIAGAAGRARRAESLWGGAAGIRRGKGRADGAGGIAASGLDGSGFGAPSQRRRGEGPDGGAVATGDDHDVEMDRRAVAHGELNAGAELPGRNHKTTNLSVSSED
jgi:hypothetical protein